MSVTTTSAKLPDRHGQLSPPGEPPRPKKPFPLAQIGFWVLAIVISFFLLLPLYILFKESVSTLAEATAAKPAYWIHHVTWANWHRLAVWADLGPPLKHSLIVAFGTAAVAIAFSAPAAYVISRLPRGWRYAVVLGILFTRMFPEVIIATPIASNFFKWGLNDTNIGLILAELIRSLPLVAWILVGTFEVIPRELEEASFVDGNGRVGTLIRVVLPLAAPGIAVAAIFSWLDAWNDLLYVVYLFLTQSTLTKQVYYYANRGNVTDVATYSVLLTIPVILLTLVLQRWIKSGYMSGAVKG